MACEHAKTEARLQCRVADMLVELAKSGPTAADMSLFEEALTWYQRSCDACDAAFGAGTPASATPRRRLGRLRHHLESEKDEDVDTHESVTEEAPAEVASPSDAPATSTLATQTRALATQFEAAAHLV
jgi:hypothetical protein